jgi:hypothetical protein
MRVEGAARMPGQIGPVEGVETMKLGVWYIQEVRDVQPGSVAARSMVPQTFGYQPIRFLRRKQPSLGDIYPTIEEARRACGSPDAEVM